MEKVKCSGIAEVVLTAPDPDKAREAQEEALVEQFMVAEKVFTRDPLEFEDKDKDKVDDRIDAPAE